MQQEEIIFELDIFDLDETRLMLEMKSWRLYFPDEELKLILAEALNDTIIAKRILIRGYLITSWRLYLILWADEEQTEEFLKHFTNCMIRNIIKKVETDLKEHRSSGDFHAFQELFVRYPFYNAELVDLLIGKELKTNYYQPKLAWMKDQLKNYKFCSVRNYTGAKGPVFINGID